MPEGDIKNEGRQPDVTIHLYSLDVNAINAEYRKFRLSGCKWSIWGSSFFKNEGTQNCSGLTLYLLKCGGIENLIGSCRPDTGIQCGTMVGMYPVALALAGLSAGIAVPLFLLYGVATIKVCEKTFDQIVVTPSNIAELAERLYVREHKQYVITGDENRLVRSKIDTLGDSCEFFNPNQKYSEDYEEFNPDIKPNDSSPAAKKIPCTLI